MENFSQLDSQFRDKKVLYITTKNRDYIRVTQEINYLSEIASQVLEIGSKEKGYGKRLLQVFRALRRQSMDEVDVVFVGFAPQLVMPFFYHKLKKRPIIIDFFISVYDTMVLDRKKFRDGGLLSRFCKLLDMGTLKRADYIVCDTKAHGSFFASELKADSSKLRVLYLEADKSIYFPRQIQREAGAPKKVLYFGSILNLQGVETILEAVTKFAGTQGVEFEIIGPIPASMTKPTQDNVTFIDWLTQEQLAEHIAAADLCLAGHFSGTIMKAKRTIPGKAYIYEAMGKPMILGDGPANHELFEADDHHIFVEMGNADALASAIKDYFKNEQD